MEKVIKTIQVITIALKLVECYLDLKKLTETSIEPHLVDFDNSF